MFIEPASVLYTGAVQIYKSDRISKYHWFCTFIRSSGKTDPMKPVTIRSSLDASMSTFEVSGVKKLYYMLYQYGMKHNANIWGDSSLS